MILGRQQIHKPSGSNHNKINKSQTQVANGKNIVIDSAIIVPNSKMTGDNIVNYSTKGTRRVDMVFGIGSEDDIDKARNTIMEILALDERILPDPPVKITVSELVDSSVNFIARPWVNSGDYWGVYWETFEKVKKQFDAQSISIPFPQRDIHVYEHKQE